MRSSCSCARPEPRDVGVPFTVLLSVSTSRWKGLEKGEKVYLHLASLNIGVKIQRVSYNIRWSQIIGKRLVLLSQPVGFFLNLKFGCCL